MNILTILILVIISVTSSYATENFAKFEDTKSGLFQFQTSNDFFYKTDKDYTGGAQILWKPQGINGGFRIGQEIYTPEKTTAVQPENEHPYASYRYLGLFYNVHISKYFRIYIAGEAGQVGPQTKGEQIQNGIHARTDNSLYDGWDNQIFDEDVYSYTISPKLDLPIISFDTSIIDMRTTAYGFATGGDLINTYGVGGEFKFGHNIPTYTNMVESEFYAYAFATFKYANTDKNILIEGNTMENDDGTIDSSYGVTLENMYNEFSLGLVANFYDFSVKFEGVTRSKRYQESKYEYDKFGTITFGWNY